MTGHQDSSFGPRSEETWAGFVAGKAPVELLAAQYLPRLRAFVRARLGTELAAVEAPSDIVQSVCRELCTQPESLQFPTEAEFRGWLFTVALNKIKARARYWGQERRDLARETPGDVECRRELAASLTPSRIAASREEFAKLETALASLREDYRESITLSRIAGLGHREIAALTGRTEKASRAMLGRALRALAAALQNPHSGHAEGPTSDEP